MRLINILLCIILAFEAYSNNQSQKPIIGISCSNSKSTSSVSKSYCDAITQHGGIALMIPVSTDSLTLSEVLGCVDGLIMTGGGDINPSYFGEEMISECGIPDSIRDIYDINLIKIAAKKSIPLLGICRGEQLINVAFGGTLYQDLPSQYECGCLIQHRDTIHDIYPLPDTWIDNISGIKAFEANTFHHQAVKDLAPEFTATAYSSDGVVEVIECTTGKPIWGVQFHPERMLTNDCDSIAHRIFKFFINKAVEFKCTKDLP